MHRRDSAELGERRDVPLVTPTIASGTVTVKACAKLLDGHMDPVSSDNCKTVSIPIG
jgi:hypothetical protein